MTDDFNPENFAFSSTEAAAVAMEQLKVADAGSTRALAFDVDGLRDYLVPVMPGQFATLIGQTSNFKTGLIRLLENGQAERLVASKRKNAAIFHVATEDTLEDIMYQEIVRISGADMRKLVTGQVDDWAPIEMAVGRLSTVPIIRIAYSASNIPLKPSLSMTNIEKVIAYACKVFAIEDVAGVYLDYLQAVANEEMANRDRNENTMRLQVRGNVFSFRRMIGRLNAPGVMGVQATTDLKYAYSPTIRLPSHYDGQETSSIGQHAQRVVSTWLPKMTPQVVKNGKVEFGGRYFEVTDRLLFVWVPKQQGNLPGGKVFVYQINYKDHTLSLYPGQ